MSEGKGRLPPVIERGLRAALVLFLAAVAFFSYFTPLEEGDFFWHLKTGEWIWEHRALPEADPFNCTTPAKLTTTQHFTLTSYWVSQLLYFLAVREAGLGGIVVLNLLVLGALLFSVYLGRDGDDLLTLGLLVIFVCLLGLVSLERPQAFSFVLFAILLLVLSRLRGSPPGSPASVAWAAAVPLLMLLWSNMHGAYLLGQGVLLLQLAADGFQLYRSRLQGPERQRLRLSSLAAAGGLLCSLANPNSWHAVGHLRPGASALLAANIEYQPPFVVFRQMHLSSVALFGLFLGLCLAAFLLRLREPDVPRIALLLILGFYAVRQIRYVPFFCIAALPFIVRGLSGGRHTPWVRVLVMSAALAAGGVSLLHDRGNLRATRAAGWVSAKFPVRAADFVLANAPRGNIYNFYDWGGYLIWRLGPRWKVFLDGRGLDDGVFRSSLKIDRAQRDPASGALVWRASFSRYGVGVVVLPTFNAGQVYPLTLSLLDDPGWSCVLADPTAVVFVRRSPENLGLAESRGMPREQTLDTLAMLCRLKLSGDPSNSLTTLSLGDILLKRGRVAEARAAFALASRLAPGVAAIQRRLTAADRLLAGEAEAR